MQDAGPLIGVLGGMGPLATVDFLARLVEAAGGACDQDHWRTITYSNPRIPDRSEALINGGPSPLPDLLDGMAMLARCGADVIAIPCNTAHSWLTELSRSVSVPIISILDAVGRDLERRGIASGRIGIFGTAGLLRAGLYQREFGARGYEVVLPSDNDAAQLVEPAIRAIKAGALAEAQAPLRAALRAMEHRDVSAVVLACTELPLALTSPASDGGVPLIDSTRCLVRECLGWAAAFEARTAFEEPAHLPRYALA